MSKLIIDSGTLTSIGDAIREKTGKQDLLSPSQMATEISNISVGGGGDSDIEVQYDAAALGSSVSADCTYAFAGSNNFLKIALEHNWIDKNISVDLSSSLLTGMFYKTFLTDWPFILTFNPSWSNATLNNTDFFTGSKIQTISGKILIPDKTIRIKQSFFTNMMYLQRLDEPICIYTEDNTPAIINSGNKAFSNCRSLRTINPNIISSYQPDTRDTHFVMGFEYCHALESIGGIQWNDYANSTNTLSGMAYQCNRLKSFTFAMNGSEVQIKKYKSQTLDLSKEVGWTSNLGNILGYYSGLTTETQVTNDETYQLLKDNPDYWTGDYRYSRYNHDSAVETINSLPDTHDYGTNTIKFYGSAGELTDGGAINTLTPEEIAVATAKGWTVTLV